MIHDECSSWRSGRTLAELIAASLLWGEIHIDIARLLSRSECTVALNRSELAEILVFQK